MERFPAEWARMNVVLCHDWLTGMRGGERVLEILCRGFPGAPIYTLVYNAAAVSAEINAHAVHASWLQRLPRITRTYRRYLPLFPAAIESLRPPAADLLISTSHCAAKGLRPGPGTRHLCYCFTPMRYAWTFYEEYFGRSPLKALLVRPLLAHLRAWDRRTAGRVDLFVAISRHVQDRIRRFYGRESELVYPPVDTERCTPGPGAQRGEFDLVVSALVPYKRVDLAVRAYGRSGFPLKVVGVGGELERLRGDAAPNVQFLGWQSDDAVLELYRGCRLLVFPGEEDFGIVPLEAQACGKPVVAFGRGGALETVREGETGCFFETQSEEALQDAVQRCAAVRWDAQAIRDHACGFSAARFVEGLARCVSRCAAAPTGSRL